MKILIKIIKWIVGIIFIISGVIKTIDPIGFSIKLEEYFEVFDITFFNEYSLLISVTISILEVLLGIFLILGIYKKLTLWSLLLMTIFFAFLTFYSAYFDVVRDCGCFGDAIKLTPWQSFFKDIFLLILISILYGGRRHLDLFFTQPIGSYIAIASLVVLSYIAFLGTYHLPIIDFRPYAVGNNIIDGLKSAEDLGLKPPQYQVKYNLKNKLNGHTIQLSEDQYISDKSYWSKGTVWELVNTEEKLISEGYQPPIHDFVIECGDNGDMTYYYLNLPQLVLLVTPVPSEASAESMNRITKFAESVQLLNIPIISVASEKVIIGNLETCLMDATTLKTMIRGNPGIIILENGTVKAKFHWRDAPNSKQLENILN